MDSGGSAGWEGGCEQNRDDDECGGGCESVRIVDAYSIELAAEEVCEQDDGGKRDDGGDGGDEGHLAQDRDDDAGARGSEGEADADFAGALFGGVGKDTVEADGGKDQREEREADGKDGEGLFAGGDDVGLGLYGTEAVNDQGGVEVVNCPPDGGYSRLGRLRGLNVDLNAVWMLVLEIGAIDGGPSWVRRSVWCVSPTTPTIAVSSLASGPVWSVIMRPSAFWGEPKKRLAKARLTTATLVGLLTSAGVNSRPTSNGWRKVAK